MQTNFSFLKNSWLTHTAVFLLVLILSVTSNLLQAQTVNISTDQDDYAPGEWVVITGSGWIPGDSVQLSITHIGDYIPNHTHAPWTLVADANGNISDQWYVADIELNTTLWLQAQSISVSSMYAQKVFTDATAHYYYGGTGDLTNVNSWWSATNGTGTHPSNFTSNNQDFQIRNISSVTLDANWVLTGNTALVIVGDGTNPCNLIIPSTVNLTSGTINVSAAATLTIQNTTIPAIGILGATSTIDYAASGNQTITSKTYGNLILSVSGAKTLGGATIANGTLTINSGVTLTTANNDLTFGGDFINNGGTLTAGSSKIMIANTNSTQNIAGITFAGTVYMTKTSGTATFTGNVSSNGLTINGIGGILNLGTGLTHTFSGTWTRTNGTLDGGSSTLKIGGNGSGSGGTFTAGTGTVEWNASGTQTIAAVAYNNLILSGSGAKTMTGVSTINGNFTLSGTASATATTGITIGRTLTLGSGTTFIAGNLIHNIKGDWTNNGGTFTNSGSTINFNGTVDQIIGGSNLTSFDKLSIGTGSKVNLSIFTHTANTLTLGGLGTASGTWGNTAGIDHPNTTYFASANGKVTVGSDTRTTPTITWANPAAITYGTALSATQLNATVSLPGSFVYTPASGAVLNAGNAQNLSVTFTPTDLTSYTTASKTVQINVNKLTIAVTAAAKTKVYGLLDTALTYTFTPALIGSDVFSGSLSRTAGEPVAVYAINQNTLALSTNYTLNYTSASLTITAMPITVTANTGQTKVYGAADPAFTYTSVPTGTLANGAAVSFTGALDRVAGENVGTTYAIGQGNLANTNYTITFVSKNFADH